MPGQLLAWQIYPQKTRGAVAAGYRHLAGIGLLLGSGTATPPSDISSPWKGRADVAVLSPSR